MHDIMPGQLAGTVCQWGVFGPALLYNAYQACVRVYELSKGKSTDAL